MMTDLSSTTETKATEKRWYIIHTYSGYENKVKTNLEHRIESMGMEDKIFQVLVPMEDEIEIRQGQRHTVQKKVYPGYVLVDPGPRQLVRRPQHAGRDQLRRWRQHPGRPE
jgi:transcriptional antiterminator NusG